jgi:hypothetical protein
MSRFGVGCAAALPLAELAELEAGRPLEGAIAPEASGIGGASNRK